MSRLVLHPQGIPAVAPIPGSSLWLDDVRIPEDGWDWVKTVPQAIQALETKSYAIASLDHDLGFAEGWDGREGIHLLDWMMEHSVWPTEAIYVHSWNPPGAERMCALINRHGPYTRLVGPTPAQSMPFFDVDDVPEHMRDQWIDPDPMQEMDSIIAASRDVVGDE